jgi:oxygen-independent coproporphyrinogen-3 oxidase
MNKSVYIHIPFCKKICSYCDFCKFYYNEKWANSYLNTLEKEIKDRYMDEIIDTIYIGGGTPSCLTFDELNKLF